MARNTGKGHRGRSQALIDGAQEKIKEIEAKKLVIDDLKEIHNRRY